MAQPPAEKSGVDMEIEVTEDLLQVLQGAEASDQGFQLLLKLEENLGKSVRLSVANVNFLTKWVGKQLEVAREMRECAIALEDDTAHGMLVDEMASMRSIEQSLKSGQVPRTGGAKLATR